MSPGNEISLEYRQLDATTAVMMSRASRSPKLVLPQKPLNDRIKKRVVVGDVHMAVGVIVRVAQGEKFEISKISPYQRGSGGLSQSGGPQGQHRSLRALFIRQNSILTNGWLTLGGVGQSECQSLQILAKQCAAILIVSRTSPYSLLSSGISRVMPWKTIAASSKSSPRSAKVFSRFSGS